MGRQFYATKEAMKAAGAKLVEVVSKDVYDIDDCGIEYVKYTIDNSLWELPTGVEMTSYSAVDFHVDANSWGSNWSEILEPFVQQTNVEFQFI